MFEIASTRWNHVPTSMDMLLYTLLVKSCNEFFSPVERYVLVALSTYKQSWHMNSSLFQQLSILGILRKESSYLFDQQRVSFITECSQCL